MSARTRLTLSVATGAVLALAACGGGQADTPAPTGRADTKATVVGLYGAQAIAQLDPAKFRNFADYQGTALVYDGLVHFGSKGTIEPELATSWAFSPDGSALDLTLNPAARFQNGRPLDAAAVKASLDRARTVEGSTVADRLKTVKAVEVVDPAHVRLRLGPGAGNLLEILAGPVGRIVGDTGGRDISLDPGDAASGPYRVVELQPNSRAVFERIPDYWDTTFEGPGRIETSPTKDGATRITAIRSGDADVGSVSGHDIDSVQQELGGTGRFNVAVFDSPTGMLLQFDRTKAPFDDVRVRQAVGFAMDRTNIPKAVFGSTAQVATQLLPADNANADPAASDPYRHDPDRARALLAEAGLSGGFTFELACFDANFCKVAQAIQPQLAEVGITMRITQTTPADQRERIRQHKIDAAMEGTSPVPTAAMLVESLLFTPGINIAGLGNGDGQQAAAAYARALDQTATPEAVKAAYAELNRIAVVDGAWYVPMIYYHNAALGSSRLDGLEHLYDSGVMNIRALRVVSRS